MNGSLPVSTSATLAGANAAAADCTNAICEHITRACLEEFAAGTRSIILTGSLARNEGTFLRSGSTLSLIGDAEFVVVLRKESRLPSGDTVAGICRRVENALAESELVARVSAAVVHDDFLRRLKPRMFAYELRTCGVVVWGEPQILGLVPQFAASDITLEDAWRTLCNRSIEALEALAAADPDQQAIPRDVFYSIVKLYLDMATSLLLFTGDYEPGYARRAQRLSWLAATDTDGGDRPFALQAFSREVETCTTWKLNPDESLGRKASWSWCWSALQYAAALWRWELVQLTGGTLTSDTEELLAKWMHMQPAAERLRGWLYVWRECGWFRSSRHWPRWAKLARTGSPRYWIYSALGDVLLHALGPVDCQLDRASQRLPLTISSIPPGTGVTRDLLSRGIASNYHRFLAHTTA